MPMETIIALGILLALLFNFVNGLNDAANSIATVIATRVLTPLQAVGMAAFFNLIGPLLFTTAVARTIGKEIVDPAALTVHIIFIGMMIAVIWVFLSSWVGIPISASHSLVGGIMGAAIAGAGPGACLWPSLWHVLMTLLAIFSGAAAGALILPAIARWKGEATWKGYAGMGALTGSTLALPILIVSGLLPLKGILAIIVFIFVSPMLGFTAAFLLCLLTMRLIVRAGQRRIITLFNRLQILSASFYSIGHGSNDAQNAMGIITALLIAGGLQGEFLVPAWVIITSCAAISLGTLMGGWRVIRTMAKKITQLRPYHGFCAETAGGVVLSFITYFGIPVSTTHAISGAIMGVGATQGYAAVQWSIVRSIVTAWIITIPVTASCSFAAFQLYRYLFL